MAMKVTSKKPDRYIQQQALYNEVAISKGIYFATDKSGYGRLHNGFVFLGLAMPAWSLICFVALALWALYAGFRRRKVS